MALENAIFYSDWDIEDFFCDNMTVYFSNVYVTTQTQFHLFGLHI